MLADRRGVGEHGDDQGRRRRRHAVASPIASWPLMPLGAGVPTATTCVRGAEHPGREGHRVGAQVEHRAAGQLGAHDPVAVVEPLPHVGQHHPRLTRRRRRRAAGARRRSAAGRASTSPPCRTPRPAAAASPICTRLAGIQPDRLLDEHVLARLDREQRVRQVQVVRRRDVDDVDLGVGDERLVGAVGRRRPRTRRPRGARPRRCATRRPARPGGCCRAGRSTNLSGDPPGAEHPPAQRRCVEESGTRGLGRCDGIRHDSRVMS